MARFRFLILMAMSMAVTGLLVAAFLFAVLTRSNEMYLPSIEKTLQREDILWGPLFSQDTASYKLRRSLIKKPDLLFLGSSTVTQFRAQMLPDVRTYSASLAASSLPDALAFVQSLYPHVRPKLTILGIDPWWFGVDPGGYRRVAAHSLGEFSETEQIANLLREIFKADFARNLVNDPPTQEPDLIGKRIPIGYNAAALDSGFRPDGSYQYGAILLDRYPYYDQARMGFRNGFAYDTDMVRRSVGRLAYTGPPSAAAAGVLREIIRYHKQNNVGLILVFPPFAHTVFSEIQKAPNQRAYFAAVEDLVQSIASEENIEFFNYRDYATLGIDDAQTIDGLHVDEVGALAMLRDMISKSTILRELAGANAKDTMDRLATQPRTLNPHLIAP